MVKVFIRQEDECGHGKISAQEHINQFKAPVLFGRTNELAALDNAWSSATLNLVLVQGPAGIGKSALMERWLYNLQKKHWHDAEMVYSWSFFPPDLTRPLQHPVDEFFDHALRWFGETNPERFSTFFQAERLVELIQAHHSLVVLDGLSFWQTQSGNFQGHLADPRLTYLLTRLAQHNPGLCIAVTMHALPAELDSFKGLQRLPLDKLPLETCAQILRYKGVQASDEKLQQIADDFEQNPLNLHLLGGYLAIWHGGNWRQIESIPILLDDVPEGRHARRILTANAARLQMSAGTVLLYQLSLLYQPILRQHLDALLKLSPRPLLRWLFKKPDSYAEVIRPYRILNAQEQHRVIRQLQELGLLNSSGRCLCAHPWVKTFFQKEFKGYWPTAWKQANQLLVNYYQTLPPLPLRMVVAPAVFHIPEAKPSTLYKSSATQLAEALRTTNANQTQTETWLTNTSLAASAILANQQPPTNTTPLADSQNSAADQDKIATLQAELQTTPALTSSSNASQIPSEALALVENQQTITPKDYALTQAVVASNTNATTLNEQSNESVAAIESALSSSPVVITEDETVNTAASTDTTSSTTHLTPSINISKTVTDMQRVASPTDQPSNLTLKLTPANHAQVETTTFLPLTSALEQTVVTASETSSKQDITASIPFQTPATPTAANLQPITEAPVLVKPDALTPEQVNHLQTLVPQLYSLQRSLQILQQRTKKFQKSMRQLEKEVQSMHYPLAPTGTDA